MSLRSQADADYLLRALDLARRGMGLTSPNPCVGAVVVDSRGLVAGEGFHTYAGIKHAEVLALEQAGERARGGTVYVNLEPCSHQGRTGPCAEALIRAGVGRVVACMNDPNPAVSGKGFERLRQAGVEVDCGMQEAKAQRLNEGFAKYVRRGEPLITLKSAMTLDGKIAPAKRGAYQITGDKARAQVQELRHESDAILVGIGTVLADDPLLTDRSGMPRRRRLLRVVLDSQLRLPTDSRLVETAENDVMVFCAPGADARAGKLRARGVCVEAVLESGGTLDLGAVIRKLGEMQITSLLVEGGSKVNAGFLAAGLADKLFLYYAPKIMGAGVPFVPESFEPRELKLSGMKLHEFGSDFAVEGYLRDPYRSDA